MNNNSTIEELYLGCELRCLDHIMVFAHFSFEKNYEDVIYCSARTKNYFDRIVPPLKYFYEATCWQDYFYYHWIHR